MTTQTAAEALAKLAGHWTGKGVLWFGGPTHDDPNPFDGTLDVEAGKIAYTWSADGKPQQGTLTLTEGGATWTDSWHQPSTVELKPIPGGWGLLALTYSFPVPKSPDWGWRIGLGERPSGELVFHMTCVKPWGEESRAWRLVVAKKG